MVAPEAVCSKTMSECRLITYNYCLRSFYKYSDFVYSDIIEITYYFMQREDMKEKRQESHKFHFDAM